MEALVRSTMRAVPSRPNTHKYYEFKDQIFHFVIEIVLKRESLIYVYPYIKMNVFLYLFSERQRQREKRKRSRDGQNKRATNRNTRR